MALGISLGRAQSDSDFTQGIMGVARILSLILTVIFIRFTIRRLHDANRSGWFSFFLLPPATLFFLIYLFIATGSEENKWGRSVAELRVFGIRAKGWAIIGVVLFGLLFAYAAGLFATFLFDSNTHPVM